MALPTDTFKHPNPKYDECDYCGARADLWYNEWTGESLCGKCDGMRDRQQAEDECQEAFRQDYPEQARRLAEAEAALAFANDTNELLLTQLKNAQAEVAQALTLMLRRPK